MTIIYGKVMSCYLFGKYIAFKLPFFFFVCLGVESCVYLLLLTSAVISFGKKSFQSTIRSLCSL